MKQLDKVMLQSIYNAQKQFSNIRQEKPGKIKFLRAQLFMKKLFCLTRN